MDSFILIGFLKVFLKYVFNPRLPFVSIWHIAINEFESYWLYELTNKKKFTFIIIYFYYYYYYARNEWEKN